MGKRYPKSLKKHALSLYASGMSLIQVAEEIGCSNRTIMNWVNASHNVSLRSNKGTPEERFWKKVKKAGDDECWEWQASCERSGHGKLRIGSTMVKAHRFSYELHVGPIPEGMCVLHKCDNPICVNPNHLWIGTRTDNNNDMVSKQRQRGAAGERNCKAKLTEKQVKEIRRLAGKGVSRTQLATMYDVSYSTISQIVREKIWRHVA
jgi:transposase